MKLKIAVLDNGIDNKVVFVKKNIVIDLNGLPQEHNFTNEEIYFAHGTNCAMVLKKYCHGVEICSVKILEDTGKGLSKKIKPALDWCQQNNIKLINFSLGTTHFQDKATIRNIINHYANRGMVIVAASANDGYKTYPASFSNAIGVVAGEAFESETDLQKHKGIDFIAPSDHEIVLEGKTFKLGNSNSYAAPYVTAMIGNFLEKEPYSNVCTIRSELSTKAGFIYCPDWIETAWVSGQCERSRAGYYFRKVNGELKDCVSAIDTIVVGNKEEFEMYCNQAKHIVYLGKEPIENRTFNRHFWCSQQRVEQIVGSRKRVSDIDIPVIICKFSEKQDIIYWLCELRRCFAKDGHNVFTVSSRVESVLYDLEFLPKELCNESNREHVLNFLYWQTYYCQSDALLLGIDNKEKDDLNVLESVADMVILINNANGMMKADIYCDGKLEVEEVIKFLECRAIHLFYNKILKLFMEDADE